MIERSRRASVCSAYLMMDGVDHIDAEPMLPSIIKLLNDNIPDVEVKHATLEDYLDTLQKLNPSLETISGPLYSVGNKGINNMVLKNVLSSMVHLKQMNDACETELTGWAEPFDFAAADCIPTYRQGEHIRYTEPRGDFLNVAWEYLLKNHPHDSICGCSITDVHKDNEYRFRQSLQISKRITAEALECISENVDTSAMDADHYYVVFNSSQSAVDDYITVPLDLPANTCRNFQLIDANGEEIPYQLLDIQDVAFKRHAPIRMLIHFNAYETYQVAAKVKIPAMGYALIGVKLFSPIDPDYGDYKAKAEPDSIRYLGTMRQARNKWDNGKLVMEIAGNGTLVITNKETGKVYENELMFEDCADIGDGWNYVKPALDQEYLSACGKAEVAILSDGPFAVTLKLTRQMDLPTGIKNNNLKRSDEHKILEVATTVTLLKDSDTLMFRTKLNNTIDDHRLRVIFPTGFQADSFYTQTPFDMQKWPVKKPDWSNRKEIDTQVNPTQGTTFVRDGRNTVALYSKGLYEVEVSEVDSAIALTLFRAFPHETGESAADWGEMHRPMTFDYAVCFGADKTPAAALKDALAWKMGLRTCLTDRHNGSLPAVQSFAEVTAKMAVLSALVHNYKLADGQVGNLVRVFNPSDEEDAVTVAFAQPITKACQVDFLGRVNGSVKVRENTVSFKCGPHKIISVYFQPQKFEQRDEK